MITKLARIIIPGGSGVALVEAVHRSQMLFLTTMTTLDVTEQIVKIVAQVLICLATLLAVIKQYRGLKAQRANEKATDQTGAE